jgi:hypothetical protein
MERISRRRARLTADPCPHVLARVRVLNTLSTLAVGLAAALVVARNDELKNHF